MPPPTVENSPTSNVVISQESDAKPFQQIEIRTERLLLRGARKDDLEAFFEWFRDTEAMNFWSTAAHTSTEQTEKFIDSMLGSKYNGVLDFAVCLLPTAPTGPCETSTSILVPAPIVIGKAGVYNGEEIGFIFNKAYWGKGYATEALKAIMKEFWNLNTSYAPLLADVDPRNEGSLRVLKKLGFEEVGRGEKTFETHLGWCDSVYLAAARPTHPH
ncbi:acyl-CoA N-acyltransferase [Crassisporium funariophilum]|nr:acyl-CoA N-acyltransferase [Crassisporium funariophilum]